MALWERVRTYKEAQQGYPNLSDTSHRRKGRLLAASEMVMYVLPVH